MPSQLVGQTGDRETLLPFGEFVCLSQQSGLFAGEPVDRLGVKPGWPSSARRRWYPRLAVASEIMPSSRQR